MGTESTHYELATLIRDEALRLGFSACGFASVSDVDEVVYNRWQEWIACGKHDKMQYMERYADVRSNPQSLLPEARTVISVALNYYPAEPMPDENPRFARYAYGDDYHEIIREKLQELSQYIQSLSPCRCRVCCDTAPIFERYWAVQAGIGFIGRNSQLIIPHRGSYFFLGELLTTLPLPATNTKHERLCGECHRCVQACPVGAIGQDGTIDARLCISCQTIENRGELPSIVIERMGKRVYGCDTCQEVCPHNIHACPTTIKELQPHTEMKNLSYNRLKNLTKEEFQTIFRRSAIKRAKYEGLMRNITSLDPTLFE
jgi:epoxyqueuosine reductase